MSFSPTYKVIGLMSGTSLDGLDITYCHFQKNNDQWSFFIKKAKAIAYTVPFRERLKELPNLDAVDLLSFHNEYGEWLGKQVKTFIIDNGFEVDFIASHGHTVFHQPEIGLTYQIGSGQHLANTCGLKTICDFRTNDVTLGGQGAPLVPIGDLLLFNEYDFCLNLGGISNISFQSEGERIAYDISPVNMLLNYICKKINEDYDEGGKLAKTGIINTPLLDKLNALDFYRQPYPKSLGYEWFLKEIVPLIENTKDTCENLLRTSVAHIVAQISRQVIKTTKKNATILVTGGGAHNHFLIETLKLKLKDNFKVVVPEKIILDYKEAMIFAFLGVLRDRNEINCLSSVTGATVDSSSGVIFYPTLNSK